MCLVLIYTNHLVAYHLGYAPLLFKNQGKNVLTRCLLEKQTSLIKSEHVLGSGGGGNGRAAMIYEIVVRIAFWSTPLNVTCNTFSC